MREINEGVIVNGAVSRSRCTAWMNEMMRGIWEDRRRRLDQLNIVSVSVSNLSDLLLCLAEDCDHFYWLDATKCQCQKDDDYSLLNLNVLIINTLELDSVMA